METRTVTFCCNWSMCPGLQLSEMGPDMAQAPAEAIVTMCSGRVSVELMLEALQRGAWGVLVAACPVEECEHDANYKTMGRIFLLQNLLEQCGVDPKRIRLEQIGSGESAKLKKAMDGFRADMTALGPVAVVA